MNAVRDARAVRCFPWIIRGGLFSELCIPTKAADVSVVYAIIVEAVVYKDIGIKDVFRSAMAAGLIMGIVLFLVGLGRFMSWVLAYAGVPGGAAPRGPADPANGRWVRLFLAESVPCPAYSY